MIIKEDRAVVTLGILIKIPQSSPRPLPNNIGQDINVFKVHLLLPPEHGFRPAGKVHHHTPPQPTTPQLRIQKIIESIVNAIKKARVDKRKLHVPFLSTFNYFRSWPMSRSWGWLGRGWLMYSTCWPETMFWRQRKMNFESIFILPNVIGDRSRRRYGGIFIKIPKVTSTWSSLLPSLPQLVQPIKSPQIIFFLQKSF